MPYIESLKKFVSRQEFDIIQLTEDNKQERKDNDDSILLNQKRFHQIEENVGIINLKSGRSNKRQEDNHESILINKNRFSWTEDSANSANVRSSQNLVKVTALETLVKSGTGSPEGVTTAGIGTLYLRTDGGASTTLYIKETGTSNTGWIAK